MEGAQVEGEAVERNPSKGIGGGRPRYTRETRWKASRQRGGGMESGQVFEGEEVDGDQVHEGEEVEGA